MQNKTIMVLAIVSVLIGGTILPAYSAVGVVLEVRPVINPNSNGVIPMLLVGDTGFDVTNVDVGTLKFGPAGAAPTHNGHLVNVNGDGFKDLLTHYKVRDTGIASGDMEVCLTGETLDGTPFEGCADIRTVRK